MRKQRPRNSVIPKRRGKSDSRIDSFSQSAAFSYSFLIFNMLSQDGIVWEECEPNKFVCKSLKFC